MEMLQQQKKRGNPALFKKQEVEPTLPTEFDHNKKYQFELVSTYELYKPVDEKGRKVDNIYPPFYVVPNTGKSYDERQKKQRTWRFISTEESIWADEQNDMDKDEENHLLSLNENQLVFVNGLMMVSGKEENKINALLCQDMCEDKKQKMKDTPPVYRMINPETAIVNSLDGLEVELEAMKAAGEATLNEMKEYAYVLGINIEQSDAGLKRDFIMQAKANPAYFIKHFVNPKNKYAYLFYTAMKENIISSTLVEHKLVWSENKNVICEVKSDGNVVEELCSKALLGDADVLKMYEQLKKLHD